MRIQVNIVFDFLPCIKFFIWLLECIQQHADGLCCSKAWFWWIILTFEINYSHKINLFAIWEHFISNNLKLHFQKSLKITVIQCRLIMDFVDTFVLLLGLLLKYLCFRWLMWDDLLKRPFFFKLIVVLLHSIQKMSSIYCLVDKSRCLLNRVFYLFEFLMCKRFWWLHWISDSILFETEFMSCFIHLFHDILMDSRIISG